jgi:hypothetical protein
MLAIYLVFSVAGLLVLLFLLDNIQPPPRDRSHSHTTSDVTLSAYFAVRFTLRRFRSTLNSSAV